MTLLHPAPKSFVYSGYVFHSRLEHARHSFRYPAVFLGVDLDEAETIARGSGGMFGWNRFRPISIYEKDYLPGRPETTIKSRLLGYLAAQGRDVGDISRVVLVTCARWFGRVFNPVSFYFCYDAADQQVCHAAEVNNTFGETHLYLLCEGSGGMYRADKRFHVSPFHDMHGEYVFRFSQEGPKLRVDVDLHRDGKPVFVSYLSGTGHSPNAAGFRRLVPQWLFHAWLTTPRILYQAAILYFRKKLPVYTKPAPSSDMTIRIAQPSFLEHWAMKAVGRYLSGLRHGRLQIQLPDKAFLEFGGIEEGTHATIEVREWRFFSRILFGGDVGFGESFTDGDWDSEDVTAVIAFFAENAEAFDDRNILLSKVSRLANAVRHAFRRNSVEGSRKNIHAHYDLGNDFYSKWLDPSMTYSCAIFGEQAQSLEDAQRNKITALIDKARIGPDDHVLEIGCGWGAFAIEAVRRTGCRVTGVTISQRQAEWARRAVEEAGLTDRIDIQLCDYRKISGQFDRIVSIEMLEAVGDRYLSTFFRRCDELLKPNGLVVLQVITIPDQRFEAYRRGCDWIQKHIFPGGMLPSLTRMSEVMRDHSRFMVENLENIGIHYALTLKEWRRRFAASQSSGEHPTLDNRFVRAWNYYLSYCEGGFASRSLNTLQLVLTRPNNGNLPGA